MKPKPTGYSGTPLAKKLGIKAGVRIATHNAPPDYAELLAPLPADVHFEPKVGTATDLVHLFTSQKTALKQHLETLRHGVRGDCAIWVSWPKQAAKVPTDITENTIRALALPLGFVDIKVCAVSAVWSGLKLVIRKELR